jgi:para-nitrobenzyl esterase
MGRSRRLKLSLLFVAAAAAATFSMHRAHAQTSSCYVVTSNGDLQGAHVGGACAYLGVPFAASTAGNARWKPPRPAATWAPAVLNATIAPAVCPQINNAGQPTGSEDCLKLNVWTPDVPAVMHAPVIVWFHTGGFTSTSANFAAANGRRMAEETGAIVVAANYRLGPFGFLAHSRLSAEDASYPSSGNYGLLDQRAALEWVRDHISAFGGNPENVTVAGTSAGSLSVSLHLVSPGSAGLFHRAIMQSGFATFRWRSASEAEAQGNAFAAALACTDPTTVLTCVRGKSQNEVLRALPIGQDQVVETANAQWGPVIDHREIPDQPRFLYETGAFSRVPILIGTNRDEGWPFVDRSFPAGLTVDQYEARVNTEFGPDAWSVLQTYSATAFASPKEALARLIGDVEYVCGARRLALAIERTRTPVYRYSFEYQVPAVAQDHVIHGLESNLVFGNNFGPPSNYALGADDVALFRAIAGYWTRFASTGNPNVDDDSVAHWPAMRMPDGNGRGSDKYLVLDANPHEALRLRERECDFWEPWYLRSTTGMQPAAQP